MSRRERRRHAPEWKAPECESEKVAYRTQGDALGAIRAIEIGNAQAVVPTATPPQFVYKCRCGAYHLTKQPPRPQRAAS